MNTVLSFGSVLSKSVLVTLAVTIAAAGGSYARVQGIQKSQATELQTTQTEIRSLEREVQGLQQEHATLQKITKLQESILPSPDVQSAYLLNKRLKITGEQEMVRRFDRRCNGKIYVSTPHSTDLDKHTDVQMALAKAAKAYCAR